MSLAAIYVQINTMTGPARLFAPLVWLPLLCAGMLGVSGCRTPAGRDAEGPTEPSVTVAITGPVMPTSTTSVMLGIDVLEANGFHAVAGKRIGLLTHPAGVNQRGESTVDVLFNAPGVKLVALFAPEHGLRGEVKAGDDFKDSIDPRTRLPVYSFYGGNRTKAEDHLRGLDALVIDLQDIGVRSYTFYVSMRYAIEACFARGVEVIVLDRPNPLGGLKVDGPLLDRDLYSGVGGLRIPYVHGLTLGELALFAVQDPGELIIPDSVRRKGRLTVVPMRGWRRAMTWPDTGLKFVATSPLVQDFAAVVGYAMVGLGCEKPGGFASGIGKSYPFRGLSYSFPTSPGKPARIMPADQLATDLSALHLPGLAFRVLPDPANALRTGVYVEVTDWNAWNPTELSFQLMRLACRYNPPNPYTKVKAEDIFYKLVGSKTWIAALRRDGAKVNVEAFLADWKKQAAAYQQQSKKYWLYQ